jgi:hypothetical protein
MPRTRGRPPHHCRRSSCRHHHPAIVVVLPPPPLRPKSYPQNATAFISTTANSGAPTPRNSARPPRCARRVGTGPTPREIILGGGALGAGTVYFYSTSAAIVTAVAVTSTLTLEGGHVLASDNAAATVTAARTVADGGIDGPPPRRVSPYAASSMLVKGNCNKNGTKDIGIQA